MKLRLFEVGCCQLVPLFLCCLMACSESSGSSDSTERASDMMTDAQLQTDTSLEL